MTRSDVAPHLLCNSPEGCRGRSPVDEADCLRTAGHVTRMPGEFGGGSLTETGRAAHEVLRAT
ncbi:hypothetical protein GCM10027590_56370 [Nocardiopsis nanhaiensis]